MRRQRKVVGVGFGARRQLLMAASGASLLPRIATSPQQGMQGNRRSHRRLSGISSRILCQAEQLSPSPRVDAGSSSRRTRAPLPGGPCRSPTYAPRAILVADLAATGFTVMRTGLEHVEAFTKLIIRNKPQTTLDAESAVAEEDSTHSGDSETNSVPSRFLGCVQAQSGEGLKLHCQRRRCSTARLSGGTPNLTQSLLPGVEDRPFVRELHAPIKR